MGKGNWRPDHPARHVNPDTFRDQLYVTILEIEDTDDEDLIEIAYDYLKEVVGKALPDSFMPAPKDGRRDWFGGGFGVDTGTIFWNRQVIVCWDTQGDTYHQGVGVVVNPDAYTYGYGGLAEKAAAATFERIKKALLQAYPSVSVRTSAWTSAKLERVA